MLDRSRLNAYRLCMLATSLYFAVQEIEWITTYDGVTCPPTRGFVDTGPARRLAREGWSRGRRHVAWAHRITFHLRPNVLWRESRWRCEYGYVSSHWAAKLYIDDIPVAHCARDSLATMLLLAECWRKAVNSDARHSARRGVSAST